MGRHRKHAEHENHERWLVSYADFITLLFAFFVVMFATSQTDKGKTQQIAESVKKAIEEDHVVSKIAGILGGLPDDKGQGNAQWKGPGGAEKLSGQEKKYAELLPAMQLLTRDLAKEISEGFMQVSMEARGLVISFREAAFFPSGGDEIPESSFPTIIKVAEVIGKLPNPVRFEGHTDSIPLHGNVRFHSNWDLSAARAIAMMEAVATCCDLNTKRFTIAGYADNAPVADNSAADGRMRNRRVDIVVLNGDGARQEPEAARK